MVLLHEEGIASGVPEMKNEGIVGRKVDRKGILTNWLNCQPKRAFPPRPFRERAGVRVINRTVAGLPPLPPEGRGDSTNPFEALSSIEPHYNSAQCVTFLHHR
ncbi:hypothetical protein EEK96_06815 [Escherichia coli]|nr:hypothetical protein [Escherichia coli]EFN7881279.1 hypothetical protein [Escherichia coli]